MPTQRRGDYGYDAPYGLMIFGIVAMTGGIVAAIAWWRGSFHVAKIATGYFVIFLGNAISFFHTTTRGKFIEWKRILDRADLLGDERVLDMGCGRGAVMTAVAKRLTTGRVTGIDIWSRHDQSGNAREVALQNASLEGVAERVTVETGDMRALPFPAAAFDLVVSSLAIHNIKSIDDRRKAVAEAYRVLKPGGRMLIADIRTTTLYARTLEALGAVDVKRVRLGWRFWWGNPVAATTLVTASKAAASNPTGGWPR